MSSLGKVFQINLFGESHSKTFGITINNIAPGIKLDLAEIKADLSLRRPKLNSETARIEDDEFEIISGYFNGYTTGGPLTILITNNDVNSKSYDHLKDVFRPSHADYPSYKHSLGYNDYRGGGSSSGRLTSALVIAGSIAKSILKDLGVEIETRIKKVLNYIDDEFDDYENDFKNIRANKLNVISKDFEKKVFSLIDDVKGDNDSIGAQLETVVLNVEPGLGEPFFNKLDQSIANYIMSIGAIKGVSFGSGFDYLNKLGSQSADEYYYLDNEVKTYSNHNGGIVGGMATGMPIVINTIVKPTPSIGKDLRTIDKNYVDTLLKVRGRHDSSIFTRIPVVINSMVSIAILDMYSIRYGYMIQRGKK